MLVSDDEFGERTVSVLLDEKESELVFIDHPSVEMSVCTTSHYNELPYISFSTSQ